MSILHQRLRSSRISSTSRRSLCQSYRRQRRSWRPRECQSQRPRECLIPPARPAVEVPTPFEVSSPPRSRAGFLIACALIAGFVATALLLWLLLSDKSQPTADVREGPGRERTGQNSTCCTRCSAVGARPAGPSRTGPRRRSEAGAGCARRRRRRAPSHPRRRHWWPARNSAGRCQPAATGSARRREIPSARDRSFSLPASSRQ